MNKYLVWSSNDYNLGLFYRDGASGCGLLCAALNATQQLCQDAEVDMFTIVRQLQVRRPEMVATLVRECRTIQHSSLLDYFNQLKLTIRDSK